MAGKQKVILAYSGGLDTSVILKWLQVAHDYEVITVTADLGQEDDLDGVEPKALKTGATKAYIEDLREEFARDYIFPMLRSCALYEGRYLLGTSVARPLIAKRLVEIAKKEGAAAIAHGATGKGNDQVRFEVGIHALAPEMVIEDPIRDNHWSREEEIDYALQNDIPVPINKKSPYSVDENLWGRANECGILEDPWQSAPKDAYARTLPLEQTPDVPSVIELEFDQGVPVKLAGEKLKLADLILKLDRLAGQHGIGRIDHVENRLVGIKSREIYECPAAAVLMAAHKDLEDITLEKEVAHFKPVIEQKLSELIYNGLWFSPLMSALQAFLKQTQTNVTGVVRVKLFKGNVICEGRRSPNSLYDEKLATYTAADQFDQEAASGFIKLFGLPTQVYAQVQQKNGGNSYE